MYTVVSVMPASTSGPATAEESKHHIHWHSSSSASVSVASKMVQSCTSKADFTEDDLTDFWRYRKCTSHWVLEVLGNSGVRSISLHSTDRASCESLPWRELRFLVLKIIKKESQNWMAVKDGRHLKVHLQCQLLIQAKQKPFHWNSVWRVSLFFALFAC